MQPTANNGLPTRKVVRNLREQIAEFLREEIVTGRLAPGDDLPEAAIAQRFDVSRAPVREALQQLTQEGYLIARPNCGVKVAPAALPAVKPVLAELRRTIEIFALRQVIDQLTDDNFVELEAILERLQAACRKGDLVAMWREDIAFHRYFVEKAEHQDLLPVWLLVTTRIRSGPPPLKRKNRQDPLHLYELHRSLLDLIRDGQTERAAREMSEHIMI